MLMAMKDLKTHNVLEDSSLSQQEEEGQGLLHLKTFTLKIVLKSNLKDQFLVHLIFFKFLKIAMEF